MILIMPRDCCNDVRCVCFVLCSLCYKSPEIPCAHRASYSLGRLQHIPLCFKLTPKSCMMYPVFDTEATCSDAAAYDHI